MARVNLNARDAVLLKALGRLDPNQKLVFLSAAKDTLHRVAAADANAARKGYPSSRDRAALTHVTGTFRAAALALQRVGRAIPEQHLRELWSAATSRDTPYPATLLDTLQDFGRAARIGLPLPRGKHRPLKSTASIWAVRLLAQDYRSAFGKTATTASGSPFIKFCDIALPEHGFAAPSPSLMKRIIR